MEPLVRVIPHLAGSNSSGGMIVTYAIHLLSDMLSKYISIDKKSLFFRNSQSLVSQSGARSPFSANELQDDNWTYSLPLELQSNWNESNVQAQWRVVSFRPLVCPAAFIVVAAQSG